MLLAPRKLVTVTEFQDKPFNDHSGGVDDIVNITFYGTKKFLFWTYSGETTKRYIFKRTRISNDKKGKNEFTYKMSEAYKELVKQLRDNFSNQTSFLSSEDYDFFKSQYPDRFL